MVHTVVIRPHAPHRLTLSLSGKGGGEGGGDGEEDGEEQKWEIVERGRVSSRRG